MKEKYDASFWPSQKEAENARSSAYAILEFVLHRLPDEITKAAE